MNQCTPVPEASPPRARPDPRYVVETEPVPTVWWPRRRPLYEVVDTWASGRLVVDRCWRSGEAWWRCLTLNEGVA